MPFCIAKKTNWPHYPHVASRLVRCSSFPKQVKAYILFQFVKCLLRHISHHHLEWRWKWFLLNPSLLFFIPVKNITYFIWDSFQIAPTSKQLFFYYSLDAALKKILCQQEDRSEPMRTVVKINKKIVIFNFFGIWTTPKFNCCNQPINPSFKCR